MKRGGESPKSITDGTATLVAGSQKQMEVSNGKRNI